MARTNDVIQNPIFGDRVKFLITADDSKGQLLKVAVWIDPLAQGTPEHVHPVQVETFSVISGQLGLKVNTDELTLTAGQTVTVQPGTPHRFWNAGANEVQMVVELRPALKTEFFFETMYALAGRKGVAGKDGVPKNPLQFDAILHEYYGEFFLVGVPVFAQKFFARVIGGLGKLVGYKGFVAYPKDQETC